MPQFEVKNFRLFAITKSKDLYDLIKKENQAILITDEEKNEENIYLGYKKYIPKTSIFDLDPTLLDPIAKNLKTSSYLLLGLLNSLNDDDEDGMYEWIRNNSGELHWFDLFDEPEIKESNNLEKYTQAFGGIISIGTLEADSLTKTGFKINNKLIKYSESIGYYDEISETLLIYKI